MYSLKYVISISPKITIKPNSQPPWFDSDIHKICLKKERLMATFKKSQNPEDYDKFRICRKHFKKSLNEIYSSRGT